MHSVNFCQSAGGADLGCCRHKIAWTQRNKNRDDETQCSGSFRRCDDTAVSGGMYPTPRYLGHGTGTDRVEAFQNRIRL